MDVYILCIETSTTNCSVGIAKNGTLINHYEINDGYSHSEHLATSVERLLDEHKISSSDLQAVAVGVGPGSYTGLRIGVSFVKGFAYGNSLKVLACNSLEVMTHQVLLQTENTAGRYVPMLDARRDEVYTAVYDENGVELEETNAHIIEANSFQETLMTHKTYVYGTGAKKFVALSQYPERVLLVDDVYPSVKGLAGLSYQYYEQGRFEDLAYFEPFYLKEFIAGKPKKSLLTP